MKKMLSKKTNEIFYLKGSEKIFIDREKKETYPENIWGKINSELRGEINSGLWGDISGLWGDISGMWGDISGLRGEINSELRGDISGLRGEIDSGLRGNISGLRGDI